MSNKMVSMEQVYANGDKLSMSLSKCHFAGYKPAMLYTLTYGERHEGTYYNDKPTVNGEHYFMSNHSEYYLETETAIAQDAFIRRCVSEPTKASFNARPLDQFLEKEHYTPL